MSLKEGLSAPRRTLFTTSYSKKEVKKEKNVSFSPYARCLKLESQNLTAQEKTNMWWQKSDYDEFARVGRIISKAMLQGGSEIWLRSKSPSSSLTLSGSNTDEMRDKWWCKFGHSRRGLEHIASNAEGRQRYMNGRSAIQSVMQEQQRQRMFLPKGYADVDKFRTVYLKERLWARILARALGESDADAVDTNFDESRRKPRKYYLKKHFDNNSDYISTSNELHLPIFMKAIITSKRSNKKLNLDDNTASQIQRRFQKSKVIPVSSKSQEEKNKRSEGKAKTKKFANLESSTANEEEKYEGNDADNNDDASIEGPSSSYLAKVAAGWGGDESQEDMSSVLIGMGISTKPKMTVG